VKSPKLNADLIEALRSLMADEGLGFNRAIDELGVNHSTAYRWRRFGQKRISERADGDDSPHGLKAQWELVASRNQSVMVAKAERLMYDALSDDAPMCAMCGKESLSDKDKLHHARWVASKLARDDYGDRSEIQITSKMEEGFEALRVHMPAQSYRDMIIAFARLHGMDTGAVGGDGPDANDVEDGD